MNQSIKSITFKGELEVWGIYNYNGAWSVLKKQKNKDSDSYFFSKHRCLERTPPKNKNHIYAKTYINDNGIEIDYTSSRCIRHELFKDIQPRQPSDKIFAGQFIKMAASEIGLLRGYMSPAEKEGNAEIKGLKRCSPLHIADAVTIDSNSSVNFDQGVSSKPKKEKEEKKSENTNKDQKKDTSLFSKDNLPHRTQKLLGGINLKELQFLSLYGKDNDFSMIPKKEKDDFLNLLKEYFKSHEIEDKLEIKQYIDTEAIYINKRTGILLNQDQIRHLVKVVFQRIKRLNGLKAGARLAYKKNSLKVSFLKEDPDNSEEAIDKNKNLIDKINKIQFHHFFEAA